jgi:hypothetical protein
VKHKRYDAEQFLTVKAIIMKFGYKHSMQTSHCHSLVHNNWSY